MFYFNPLHLHSVHQSFLTKLPQQAPPSKLQPALLLSSSQYSSFLYWGDPHLPGAAVVEAFGVVDGSEVDEAGVGDGVDGAGVDGAGVEGDGDGLGP